MTTSQVGSVKEYIATRPENVRPVLRRLRAVIRRLLPQAEETISYQMPAYRLDGRIVLYFAGWKSHYSLYPASGRIVDALEDELARYEVSKGTIRLPLSEPVPVKLIERITKLRIAEAAERATAQRTRKKKR